MTPPPDQPFIPQDFDLKKFLEALSKMSSQPMALDPVTALANLGTAGCLLAIVIIQSVPEEVHKKNWEQMVADAAEFRKWLDTFRFQLPTPPSQ